MTVHFIYDSDTVGYLRAVLESWQRRGWAVRLLLPGARRPKTGLVMKSNVVNFHCRAKPGRIATFRKRGWQTSGLVRFSSLDDILNCGRPC